MNEIDLIKKQNKQKQEQIESKKQTQNDQYSHLSDIEKDKLIVLDGQIKNKREAYGKIN